MKKKYGYIPALLLLAFFAAILMNSCHRNRVVSLKTLLLELTDRGSLAEYPLPEYSLHQLSSYDRGSIHQDSAGWYANNDYTWFIRDENTNGRIEYVMFEDNGPGAVVRWWMTFAGEGSYNGTIRIYIDGDTIPVIESEPLPLLSGQLLTGSPLSSSVSQETDSLMRGHNLYFPIPYAISCKITYECDAIEIAPKRKPSIYYNINYRKYAKNTRVVSFNMEELEYSRLLAIDANNLLMTGSTESKNTALRKISATITTGDTLTLDYSGKNEAVTRLVVKLNSRDMEQAMRSVVITASFDGIQSVWVPVGEFFGSGYLKTNVRTYYLSADSTGNFESWWVMPFKNESVVSLINYGREDVNAELTVYYNKKIRTTNTMYFGAAWHEYHNIMAAGAEVTGGSGKHRDLNFIDIRGQGVYAGDAVTVFNTVDAWWGEGDEKIYVDGEEFPSSIGTGTEDYYGYAWCRPETFNHPFIAQPSGAGNFHPGQTINMRFRSLDAIPFREDISSNIELWHWVPAIMNYSLTTWFYFLPPAEINIKPQPDAVRNAIPRTKYDLLPLPER